MLSAVSKNRDFALELIVPSLPGYGFSDVSLHLITPSLLLSCIFVICNLLFFFQAAVRPGLGANEMAVVFRNLMKRLGFKKYYVQGGDWGSLIGSSLVTLFPGVRKY